MIEPGQDPQRGGGPDDSGPERPGSGGTATNTGGSHGAARDGDSGYDQAGTSNAFNDVSGNPDKTSYSGTDVGAASPDNPTVYRDPSVDPAAKIEAAELRELGAAARTQAVDPTGNSPAEKVPPHGEGERPTGQRGRSDPQNHEVDPAQAETDVNGTPPIPTIDPTVGTAGFMDPTGAIRTL